MRVNLIGDREKLFIRKIVQISLVHDRISVVKDIEGVIISSGDRCVGHVLNNTIVSGNELEVEASISAAVFMSPTVFTVIQENVRFRFEPIIIIYNLNAKFIAF